MVLPLPVDQEQLPHFLHFPRYFQIETVSRCNARCVMCPVEDWRRDSYLMDQALFEKIVDEISEYRDWVERVTIQLDGEPLIDKKLEDRIRYLKASGIRYVAFASNGSLMNPDRAVRVIDSGVDEVSFSVDGATKQTFEKIRVRLNFDQVVENIEHFVRTRDELHGKTVIRIRMTIQEDNEQEVDSFLSFWRGKLGPNDSVYAKVLHTWGNSDNNYSLPGEYDFDRVNNSPCSSPWTSMVIFSDGRVPLCCCDYNARVYQGSVSENTIQEIWQGKVFTKIRKLHSSRGRKAINMCENCTVWDDGARVTQDET